MDALENRPFDDITIGDSASVTKTLTRDDIALFAVVSGDLNPTHLDDTSAEASPMRRVVGHSLWGGGLISGLLGTRLPGPGTVYLAQNLRFHHRIAPGDTLTAKVTVREKRPKANVVVLDCSCTNQDGEPVLSGTAEVVAPTAKMSVPCGDLPAVSLRRHDAYERLIERCRDLEPLSTAVAHPCDESSLSAAVDAARSGIIAPVLVGPANKIRDAAQQFGLDISAFPLIEAAHSHDAAEKAVALVRTGQAEALMKGSLHTDELMAAVVKRETGLRTQRRISHCFLMDVPNYARPLIITDAAINIYPSLEDKVDIVQNAIDLARALGLERPCVAILSAVETVNPKISSTLEAAALCKMAERGQITGGVLDGPLALDNAISEEAARIKRIESPVAGHADILLVPDLEAGNMLAKNLTFLANADAAGIVLGARVPIILTSRADSVQTRLASCAVATLCARSRREATAAAAAE
ncbi:MAG TPA: bifunctional enoyl-CoA hydratase/phosphate acetyltransferase [Hyphomicrobiaceae bacterium]